MTDLSFIKLEDQCNTVVEKLEAERTHQIGILEAQLQLKGSDDKKPPAGDKDGDKDVDEKATTYADVDEKFAKPLEEKMHKRLYIGKNATKQEIAGTMEHLCLCEHTFRVDWARRIPSQADLKKEAKTKVEEDQKKEQLKKLKEEGEKKSWFGNYGQQKEADAQEKEDGSDMPEEDETLIDDDGEIVEVKGIVLQEEDEDVLGAFLSS